MSDVYFGLTLQALRCVASGVERKPLCTTAQESNAAPVSDAHEKVQIQGERFGDWKGPGRQRPCSLRSSISFGVRAMISRSS